MILNGESNIPQEVDSKKFAQLGLLVGSFMFWEEDRDDPQPQRLEKLMRWTLELPPVLIGEKNCYPRLGVSASGFAHIYYTILQAKKRQGPLSKAQEADEETITKELARLGFPSASTQQDIKEPDNNYLHFEPHIDEFARYVECLSKIEIAKLRRREAAPRMYIWLDRKDNDWWVTAIRNTLDDYLQLMSEKRLEPSDVEKLCEWLECSVFASLDISQPLPKFNGVEEKSAVLAEQVFQGARKVNGAGSKSRHFYLTWDLFAFDLWGDYWREQLLHRTMLVLWTAWPDDMAWAPRPPKGFSSPSLSLQEATLLLRDLLPALRRYFLLVKDAHRLSLTKLIFEKTGGPQVHYPPTFYFADPIDRLPTTTEYAEIADVHHLISNCIVYYEQYADKLSWSTLEGSMSTIRGEKTLTGHYKARYLLLPNVARSANDKVIGSDLDHIVGNLTFVEYTIGLEALDIFNRVRDIESKRAVDSDTINTMDYISRKLASIVSSSPGETLKSGAEEFAELQLLLGRVQYAFEKMQGEAVLLEQQYVFLINRTNEYLRETMIMTPVPEQPDLSAALVDAYPYHYLRNPMNYLPVYTTQLANSIERLGALVTLLSTATSNDELKQRERQSRAISLFGVLIAVAALLFALPAFFPKVNAQSILKLIGYEGIYTSNTGIVALVMLALALLGFLLWFCVWSFRRIRVYSRPKKERNLFRECVLKFWNLADYVTYMYETEKRSKDGLPPFSPVLRPPPPSWFEKQWKSGWGADDIDSQATLILQELWSFFDSPSHASHSKNRRDWSDNWQQTSEDLIRQVRILSRLIHVFVLRPDLIPLPRALCIMRYKSFQFLEKSTIGDNEFRDSLKYAGYASDQVKSLQDWLYEPVNLKWIRDRENSVEKVAEALKNAGITTKPPEDVEERWQGDLFMEPS